MNILFLVNVVFGRDKRDMLLVTKFVYLYLLYLLCLFIFPFSLFVSFIFQNNDKLSGLCFKLLLSIFCTNHKLAANG